MKIAIEHFVLFVEHVSYRENYYYRKNKWFVVQYRRVKMQGRYFEEETRMNPMIKYRGGKSKELAHFIGLCQKNIQGI